MKDKWEVVEIALGKPVGGDLTNNALKVRRNLLVFGMIAVFIKLGGVELDGTPPPCKGIEEIL